MPDCDDDADDLAMGSERTFRLARHAIIITRSDQGGSVRLVAPDATEALCIDITPDGARLRLARGLSIAIDGPLSFEADSVAIRARDNITLASDGDARIAVAGRVVTSSRSNTIETTHGDIKLDANDDVVLQGERIRANC